jgi:RecB family exonuclease
MGTDPDLVDLHLGDEQAQQLLDDAEALVRQYFRLEDPTRVHPIGLELRLSAEVGGTTMRGVIDRLRELGANDIRELDGKPEDMVFALPRELRVQLVD